MTCYRRGKGNVHTSSGDAPMGDASLKFRPCCTKGDTYLSHDICLLNGSIKGGSGYYTAGCTDPKFGAVACTMQCSNLGRGDILYNSAQKLWYCCGGNATQAFCENPTDFTFQAPSPDDLGKQPSTKISMTHTPSATNAPSGSITDPTGAASTSSPTETAQSSSGINGGAVAGIVIGIVVILGLLVVGGWFLFRQRRRKQAQEATLPFKVQNVDEVSMCKGPEQEDGAEIPPAGAYGLVDKKSVGKYSVGSGTPRQEMDAAEPLLEMGAPGSVGQMQELDAMSPAVSPGRRTPMLVVDTASSREGSARGSQTGTPRSGGER